MRNRRRSWSMGYFAEYFAAILLFCKCYRIIAHRFKTPVGEIDLISRRGSHFAFVEVKWRRTLPADGVVLTTRQSCRIRKAADLWLARQDMQGRLPECWSASFDLIVICPWRFPMHLKNVF